MRLFFAIALAEPTLDALALVVEDLRARSLTAPIAWENRGKLHITVKFLGEVVEDAVPSLVHAARKVGERHARFDLSLGTLSAFPTHDEPRILWIGTEQGSDHVTAIAEDLDASLAPLGLERETRPFVPHVTVARARRDAAVQALRRLLEAPPSMLLSSSTTFPLSHVGAFTLMVSRAGVYETLHEIELLR